MFSVLTDAVFTARTKYCGIHLIFRWILRSSDKDRASCYLRTFLFRWVVMIRSQVCRAIHQILSLSSQALSKAPFLSHTMDSPAGKGNVERIYVWHFQTSSVKLFLLSVLIGLEPSRQPSKSRLEMSQFPPAQVHDCLWSGSFSRKPLLTGLEMNRTWVRDKIPLWIITEIWEFVCYSI